MFDWLKKRVSSPSQEKTASPSQEKPSLLSRLKESFTQNRQRLQEGLSSLFYGRKKLDDDMQDALETLLLQADLGFALTDTILQDCIRTLSREALVDAAQVQQHIRQALAEKLIPVPLKTFQESKPFIIACVGVNGAGKTTSLGKLAWYLKEQHALKTCLIAGDTFRAAAVEQLQSWAESAQTRCFARPDRHDSAAVIYEGLQEAHQHDDDVILIDTAGRLHAQEHLMQELSKMRRVMSKVYPGAPHLTLLVLDATLGQNALAQAQAFHQATPLDGLILTKMDSSAKAGALFAISDALKLPVYFVGTGERIDDFYPFDPEAFLEAFLSSSLPEEQNV